MDLEKNKLCYYCLGCNRLEIKNFVGVKRCNNFEAGMDNWQEKWREELKK